LTYRDKPILSKQEAIQLHNDSLVIDSQQPPITSGALFTKNMKETLDEWFKDGMTRGEARGHLSNMIADEIQNDQDARNQYIDLWNKSGVTVASGTYAGPAKMEDAYEISVNGIANAISIINAIPEKLMLVTTSDHIVEAHETNKYGIIFDFQDTTSFGTDLNKVDFFYNLGLRVVQLTYNLRNLVGDGCTELHKSGLTYFGKELVSKLNDMNILVDVSHCSEQVGWDTIETSKSPVVITHSASAAVFKHDRGKGDKLAKAIADNGGFFGVVIIPGFIQGSDTGNLDHWAMHIEHLVNIMGIDHICIGTDKMGPGPGTESLFEYPGEMPFAKAGEFSWQGWQEKHRVNGPSATGIKLEGYNDFGDWPNLTIKLAERGFNEEEIRKMLGFNYLRVYKEVVG
jgi:membrane dipeptidase